MIFTSPKLRRYSAKSGVMGSSRTNSFIRDPSTQSFLWRDLSTRTPRHLREGIRDPFALFGCIQQERESRTDPLPPLILW